MLPFLLAAAMLTAQDSPSPQVTELVAQLVANSLRYGRAMPSLSCEQTVHSQVVSKGKVKREVVSTAILTVARTGKPDDPFLETYHWQTVDGKPLKEGWFPRHPYFVHGIFSNALGFYDADLLRCSNFVLTDLAGTGELRLDIEQKPDAPMPACRTAMPGERRTIYIDRVTRHVQRLFRMLPGEEATRAHDTAYASVEYHPVQLGAETFWLPLRGEARDQAEPINNDERRMQVEYTGCHRYASTVTITGGTQTVPDPQ